MGDSKFFYKNKDKILWTRIGWNYSFDEVDEVPIIANKTPITEIILTTF